MLVVGKPFLCAKLTIPKNRASAMRYEPPRPRGKNSPFEPQKRGLSDASHLYFLYFLYGGPIRRKNPASSRVKPPVLSPNNGLQNRDRKGA